MRLGKALAVGMVEIEQEEASPVQVLPGTATPGVTVRQDSPAEPAGFQDAEVGEQVATPQIR